MDPSALGFHGLPVNGDEDVDRLRDHARNIIMERLGGRVASGTLDAQCASLLNT
jgi:hypothetical protein